MRPDSGLFAPHKGVRLPSRSGKSHDHYAETTSDPPCPAGSRPADRPAWRAARSCGGTACRAARAAPCGAAAGRRPRSPPAAGPWPEPDRTPAHPANAGVVTARRARRGPPDGLRAACPAGRGVRTSCHRLQYGVCSAGVPAGRPSRRCGGDGLLSGVAAPPKAVGPRGARGPMPAPVFGRIARSGQSPCAVARIGTGDLSGGADRRRPASKLRRHLSPRGVQIP